VLGVVLAPAADDVCAAGAAWLPGPPPPPPPPPFGEGNAWFEDAVGLPITDWSMFVLMMKSCTLVGDSDTDRDADFEALLSDAADAVRDDDDDDGVLAVDDCDAELVEDATLLPEMLATVEPSEEVERPVLTCNASADAADPYGYAGTENPLGNGGTAGTCGKASVGNGGTAGTCGNDGTGGVEGTAGSTTLTTADATELTAFTAGATADSTGAIAFPNASTSPGVGVLGMPGVFVSCPTMFPLESTVATTSTLTVTTLVPACACRRWKKRWSFVITTSCVPLSRCFNDGWPEPPARLSFSSFALSFFSLVRLSSCMRGRCRRSDRYLRDEVSWISIQCVVG
jgi:hypothetical protein